MSPQRVLGHGSLAALALLLLALAIPADDTPAALLEPKPAYTLKNPRGEPLLYQINSADIRPLGMAWSGVTVSPDGKTIATIHGPGDGPSEVRLWDRDSGKVRKVVSVETTLVAVAFTPDSKTIASGGSDGIVRLHDVATGSLWGVAEEPGRHNNGIVALCICRGGKVLITAGNDNFVRVWDLAAINAKRKPDEPVAFPPVMAFLAHDQALMAVAASADGRMLVTGSNDNLVKLWDLPAVLPKMGLKVGSLKKERLELRGHASGVASVAVSPDGKLVATGAQNGEVFTWTRDGKRAEITGNLTYPITGLCFSLDGKRLAACAGNVGADGQPGQARVWDVAERKELAARTDYPGPVSDLAFTPDGGWIATVGDDRALHLWNIADSKANRLFRAEGLNYDSQPLAAVALSPSGDLLAVAGDAKEIFIYERGKKRLVAGLVGHGDIVCGLAFSPDGKTLASCSHDRTVKLWDTATWKERRTLSGHTGWVFCVTFSPDGQTVATGSYDKTIGLWKVESGQRTATWKEHTAGVRTVAFDAAGKRLASAGADRTIRIWDIDAAKVVSLLKGHKGAVRAVEFSPDGSTLASGSEDRSAIVWDLAAGKEKFTFGSLPDLVGMVRFSPKGQTLAIGTFQGPVMIVDPVLGRKRQELAAHNEAVTAAVFSRDGKQLFTVSLDRTIREWPATPPGEVAPLESWPGKPRLVQALGTLPGDTAALLGGADGSVIRWEFKTGEEKPLPAFKHTAGVLQIAVSRDGRIATVGSDHGILVGKPEDAKPWKSQGEFTCFSPDGTQIAIVHGKDVLLHDAAAGKTIRKFSGGHDGAIQCATFDHSGKVLATAGLDTKIRLWDVATGEKKQLSAPLGNSVRIPWIGFNGNSTVLAVAANSPEAAEVNDMTGQFQVTRTVFIYSMPKGPGEMDALTAHNPGAADDPNNRNINPPPRLPIPPGVQISAVAWVTQGGELATLTNDGFIRFWKPQDGNPGAYQQTHDFRVHDAAPVAASGSVDGKWIVTSGEDLTVRRWQTAK